MQPSPSVCRWVLQKAVDWVKFYSHVFCFTCSLAGHDQRKAGEHGGGGEEMRSTLWLRVVVGGAMRCALTNMLHLHSMSQIASAQIFGTEGLISTDRGTKPTLMLTIPRSIQSRLQRIYLSQHLKLCVGSPRGLHLYDVGPGGLSLFALHRER